MGGPGKLRLRAARIGGLSYPNGGQRAMRRVELDSDRVNGEGAVPEGVGIGIGIGVVGETFDVSPIL